MKQINVQIPIIDPKTKAVTMHIVGGRQLSKTFMITPTQSSFDGLALVNLYTLTHIPSGQMVFDPYTEEQILTFWGRLPEQVKAELDTAEKAASCIGLRCAVMAVNVFRLGLVT